MCVCLYFPNSLPRIVRKEKLIRGSNELQRKPEQDRFLKCRAADGFHLRGVHEPHERGGVRHRPGQLYTRSVEEKDKKLKAILFVGPFVCGYQKYDVYHLLHIPLFFQLFNGFLLRLKLLLCDRMFRAQVVEGCIECLFGFGLEQFHVFDLLFDETNKFRR